METTPVKLLEEQIKYYHSFIKIISRDVLEKKITKEKYESLICETTNKIKEFTEAVNILNEAICSEEKNCSSCLNTDYISTYSPCYGCVDFSKWMSNFNEA